MPQRFYERAFTPVLNAEQEKHGSARQYDCMQRSDAFRNTLGPDEQHFLALRQLLYALCVRDWLGLYPASWWPPGFVYVLSPSLVGFADLRGNTQYISLGNLQHNNRVALFFWTTLIRRDS